MYQNLNNKGIVSSILSISMLYFVYKVSGLDIIVMRLQLGLQLISLYK
jgi:hypothetical protein